MGYFLRFIRYIPFLRKQLNEIYFVHSIDMFVFSLIAIFVPIYLLSLGYPLSAVLLFFITKYACVIPFAFLVAWISNHYGLKHTLLFRLPFTFLFLLGLIQVKTLPLPLPLLGVLDSFQTVLYWLPLHSLFTRSSHRDHLGLEVSKLYSFPTLLSIFAPLLGAGITLTFGFPALFLTAILLLLFSLIPLFYTPERRSHVNFKIKEGFDIFRKNPKFFLATGLNYIANTGENILWPVFVFLLLQSVFSIGMIGTLFALGSVGFALLIGRLSDRVQRSGLVKIGSFLLIFIWLLRFFVQQDIPAYILTLMAGFFMILISIPFMSITYQEAKSTNIDEFIVYREISVALGRLFILSLALVFPLTYLFPIISLALVLFFTIF